MDTGPYELYGFYIPSSGGSGGGGGGGGGLKGYKRQRQSYTTSRKINKCDQMEVSTCTML